MTTESQIRPQTTLLQDRQSMMVLTAAEAADDRKATDISILAIGEVSVLADYFAIVTGTSRAQVRAIANSIREKVAENFGYKPLRTSGEQDGSWVLLDYGDIIVHVMMPKEREFYNLEAFWGHAPRYALSEYKSLVAG